jgi:hypothetical protein
MPNPIFWFLTIAFCVAWGLFWFRAKEAKRLTDPSREDEIVFRNYMLLRNIAAILAISSLVMQILQSVKVI